MKYLMTCESLANIKGNLQRALLSYLNKFATDSKFSKCQMTHIVLDEMGVKFDWENSVMIVVTDIGEWQVTYRFTRKEFLSAMKFLREEILVDLISMEIDPHNQNMHQLFFNDGDMIEVIDRIDQINIFDDIEDMKASTYGKKFGL